MPETSRGAGTSVKSCGSCSPGRLQELRQDRTCTVRGGRGAWRSRSAWEPRAGAFGQPLHANCRSTKRACTQLHRHPPSGMPPSPEHHARLGGIQREQPRLRRRGGWLPRQHQNGAIGALGQRIGHAKLLLDVPVACRDEGRWWAADLRGWVSAPGGEAGAALRTHCARTRHAHARVRSSRWRGRPASAERQAHRSSRCSSPPLLLPR